MQAEKMLNVRLPGELAEKLAALAKTTGRTKSEHAVRALSTYLDVEAWQIADIEEGIKEADRGEFASADAVNTFFAKYGS